MGTAAFDSRKLATPLLRVLMYSALHITKDTAVQNKETRRGTLNSFHCKSPRHFPAVLYDHGTWSLTLTEHNPVGTGEQAAQGNMWT
jgi:hypothetical protein